MISLGPDAFLELITKYAAQRQRIRMVDIQQFCVFSSLHVALNRKKHEAVPSLFSVPSHTGQLFPPINDCNGYD